MLGDRYRVEFQQIFTDDPPGRPPVFPAKATLLPIPYVFFIWESLIDKLYYLNLTYLPLQ